MALYEARWGAVLTFLKALIPMVPTLAATFDVKKFEDGVDLDGVYVFECNGSSR